ncbi:MAG: DUF1580 domain-containing protein [Pirellulaceae bacterium]|nr:DUF1580 domain-containing protein [Pirellulaceae bacterium]
MIDPNTESLLSLTEATKRLPRRRAGKRPNVSTLYRWSIAGCRGVILETIQVGGTRCTSREALARFFHRLTDPRQCGAGRTETPRRHARRRQREIAAANRYLDREGL